MVMQQQRDRRQELHDLAVALGAVQNNYGWLFSRFDPKEHMNSVYTSLPERNVQNTKTGYQLYQSGRVRPQP